MIFFELLMVFGEVLVHVVPEALARLFKRRKRRKPKSDVVYRSRWSHKSK